MSYPGDSPHEPGRVTSEDRQSTPVARSRGLWPPRLSDRVVVALTASVGAVALAFALARGDRLLLVLSTLVLAGSVFTLLAGRPPRWMAWLGRLRPGGKLLVLVTAALAGTVIGLVGDRNDESSSVAEADDWRLHFEISIPFRDGDFPMSQTFDALVKVDDAITDAVERRGIGEWEGQSVGAGTYDIGLLGDDQAAVLKVVEQVLRARGVAKGTVIEVTKNNAADDPVATIRL